MPFGVMIWVGPKNHVLDGGANSPGQGVILEESGCPLESIGTLYSDLCKNDSKFLT